jgi:hypothetical protein
MNPKCKKCGCEITEDDAESYDNMCWSFWIDELTEEYEII